MSASVTLLFCASFRCVAEMPVSLSALSRVLVLSRWMHIVVCLAIGLMCVLPSAALFVLIVRCIVVAVEGCNLTVVQLCEATSQCVSSN